MEYVWVFIGGWFSCIIAIHIKTWWVCRINTKVGTPSASHNTASDAISQQYYELLFAVEQKCPGESRHDTALRCIRSAQSNSGCGSVAKQHT